MSIGYEWITFKDYKTKKIIECLSLEVYGLNSNEQYPRVDFINIPLAELAEKLRPHLKALDEKIQKEID